MLDGHLSKLRSVWNQGRPAINYWMTDPSIAGVELINPLGFDSILLDTQHGACELREIYHLLVAVDYEAVTPLVRVADNDAAQIMKLLDAGAEGIMCPMINSRTDAERFVRACRYPPLGERSFGPFRAGLVYGGRDRYYRLANSEVITIAQIETMQAIDNIGEIVSTPGLDAVFIGPSDLSISAGNGPDLDYADLKMLAHQHNAVSTAHDAGVKVGTLALEPTPEVAEIVGSWGLDLISLGTDLSLQRASATTSLQLARSVLREHGGV